LTHWWGHGERANQFTSLDSLTTRFISFMILSPFAFFPRNFVYTYVDILSKRAHATRAKGFVVALLRYALIEWAHVHGGTTKIRIFSWTFWDFLFGYSMRDSEHIKGGKIHC